MPESATSKRRAQARERETKAFELRKGGATYAQIATALGVTRQGAHKMIKRTMAELSALAEEDAEEVRRMEIERLDAMLLGLWEKARRGHEGAVDRVLRIMQRRSDMLGLDAPKRSAHQLTGEGGGPPGITVRFWDGGEK